tara:strand:+ start:1945 stop:2664 length:720 start_codon:yes stop_codon:yes gene_type:complete
MLKKNKLVSDIKYANASWSFDGKTVRKFDNHIKQSVPLYDLAHDLTLKFSDFFLSEKSNIYDLGCSTGTFLNLISRRHNIKKHQFIGVDVIKKMCLEAKKKNKKNKNVKIFNSKIEDVRFKKSAIITSFFTMQFIHPSRRQFLFNKIFKSLNWGGAFFLFEKVRYPDARFQDMINQIYMDYKIDQGFSPLSILDKSRSLKGVMEPFSTNGNLQLLKRAGFKDTVNIFKFACFEGFLSIK